MALPDSHASPIHELFHTQYLDRLPTDKPVVMVCRSSTLAIAAGTALRHLGFKNVYILKGGLIALNVYLYPKTANSPVKAEQTQVK